MKYYRKIVSFKSRITDYSRIPDRIAESIIRFLRPELGTINAFIDIKLNERA